jgi:hypothetical protein
MLVVCASFSYLRRVLLLAPRITTLRPDRQNTAKRMAHGASNGLLAVRAGPPAILLCGRAVLGTPTV